MTSYYRRSTDLPGRDGVAVRVDAMAQCFAKRHEYTLGSRLRDMTMDVGMLGARCNRRADRARGLPVLCDRIEEMKVLLNLGKEVKAFASFGEFAEVMDQVVALARQAEAWRRATVANDVPEPASRPASSGEP